MDVKSSPQTVDLVVNFRYPNDMPRQRSRNLSTRLNFAVLPEQLRLAEELADALDVTVSEVMRRALREYLDKHTNE